MISFGLDLFLMSMEFLTMEKPPKANPMAQGKVLKAHFVFFFPYVYASRESLSYVELRPSLFV